MAMANNLGADKATWAHFAALVGVANLVPVAPDGKPASKSKISPLQVGKIPSYYKADGTIIGFKDWPEYRGTIASLSRWGDGRHSIGIITGRDGWYAIDVDLPNEQQQGIVYSLLYRASKFGAMPVWRGRANSNRRLYLIRVIDADPPLNKRVFSLQASPDGKECAVEFLGLGQQFVAAGTHPSGICYEWMIDPMLGPELPEPGAIPTFTYTGFLDLWSAIGAALPVVNATVAGERKSRVKGSPAATDETADWLDANGFTLSLGPSGERFIRSPREHLYTDGVSGETSVAYFPAGTGGFEQGHFKSLHASDAAMTDADWLDEFGLRVSEFENVLLEQKEEKPLPPFKRNKMGAIEVTAPNLLMALRDGRVCGCTITYDEFMQLVFIDKEPLRDEHYMMIMERLEQVYKFKPLNTKRVGEAIRLVAWENRYDSLTDRVKALKWDGVKRIDTFYMRMWAIPDSPYIRAVGRYTWTALAGRALQPGLQCDMTPLMVSIQGKRKSRSVQAMALEPSWFAELDFDQSAIERVRLMRGRCILELGEMQGMRRREIGEVRAFLSRVADTNRGLYRENFSELPRRCLFIATANDDEPLTDTAGNRRWLPMAIPDDTDPTGIVERITAERDQLWAEGAAMFLNEGLCWQDAERLARNILPDYETENQNLNQRFARWLGQESELGGPTNSELPFLVAADIVDALYSNVSATIEKSLQMQITSLLKKKGYLKDRKMVDGVRVVRWRKPA